MTTPPQKALGKNPSFSLPALVGPGAPGLGAASLQSLPPSSHGLLLSLCMSFSAAYKDISLWM